MTGTAAAADRRSRHPAFRIDLLLAAAVAVVILLGLWAEIAYASSPVVFPAGAVLLGLAAAAALLIRREHAILSSVIVLAIVLLYHLVGYPGGAAGLALFVTSYSIAAYGTAVWSLFVALGFVLLWGVIPVLPPNPLPWYSFAITGPALGMAWMIVLGAAAAQVRRAHARSLAEAAAAAQAELRERVIDERLDVARELHDVLAHTISVITVQTGVALDALDEQPETAKAAMVKVRMLARQAMPELRRTLDLLRRNPDETGHPDPQPRLAQLDQLFDEAAASGLRVDPKVALGDRALTPFTELTAYRIVQEALTNVIRHAGAASVSVSVVARGDRLRIDVADDGSGATGTTTAATASPAGATGLGLVGMRERVQAAGGTVTAGPDPRGGYLVSATLPIGEES